MNNKIQDEMVDLTSTDRSLDQLKQPNNQLIKENWSTNHIYIYTISDIYWINKWCENILKVTESIAYKCADADKEIFKITGKHSEATSSLPVVDVYVFFSLKELKEIRNYASMYYSSNIKTIEAKNTLYDINLRIKYLEKQSEKIIDTLRKSQDEVQKVMLDINRYHREDIFWYAEWVLDKPIIDKSIRNIILDCMRALDKVDDANRNPNTIICYISLKNLKEIRRYAMIHYHNLDHDFPNRNRSVEESIALCKLDERIAFKEEYKETRAKFQMEKEEKQKSSIEEEVGCRLKSELDCKSEDTCTVSKYEVRGITAAMYSTELRLLNFIKECIKQKYDVVYSCDDINAFKWYITHGECVSYIETNETKIYITIHIPYDGGNIVVDLLKEINLKSIRYENNTLYISKYKSIDNI